MIDSIRSPDGFGVSKRVDRTGPPADEGAAIYLRVHSNKNWLEVNVWIISMKFSFYY